jgi:hypothetical protein
MVGFQMIILLEWNIKDTWNRCQMKDRLTKFSISRLVELGIVGGREGKQLRAKHIQGDTHSPSDLQKMALSGPDTPGFLFLGVCEANCLQCSYAQHSTLETANQGSCCICHSCCSWSSVTGNGIPLRCLQSHQWSPHRTSINMWKKLFELFFNLIHIWYMYHLPFNRYNILKLHHDFWDTLYSTKHKHL